MGVAVSIVRANLDDLYSTPNSYIPVDNPDVGHVTGEGDYNIGDIVPMAAIPNPGFAFLLWGQVCGTSVSWTYSEEPAYGHALAQNEVSMNVPAPQKTFFAVFGNAHEVSIAVHGQGTAAGQGWHRAGRNVTLEAAPAEGWEFARWEMPGGPPVADNPHSFTMPASNMAIAAAFAPIDYAVTLDAQEGGTAAGGGTFHIGEEVAIEAVPDAGWRFLRWVDNDDGTCIEEEAHVFTMGSACRSFTAWFKRMPRTVEVRIMGDLRGLAVAGGGTYEAGEPVSLRASSLFANVKFFRFVNIFSGEAITSNPYEFEMPPEDLFFDAYFRTGAPAEIQGSPEMKLVEGYSKTASNFFAIAGNDPVEVEFDSGGAEELQWSKAERRIEISPGLPAGRYAARITADNEYSAQPCVFEWALLVIPRKGGEPEEDDGVAEVVEVARGIVPIRIPQVISGQQAYKHVPLIDLMEKRAAKNPGFFYAYELAGRNRGCLRLSRLPPNGRLEIYHDRVIALPRRASSEIDLPEGMIALVQAHTALALAKRFGTPQIETLERKAAQLCALFARQQSAIDRSAFLDPYLSYARFGGAGPAFGKW